MRVNCNISAIISNSQLSKAQNRLDKSLERLSSGLKINTAEDDAAGMAISNKLRTQLRGLDQAEKNSNDGISVVQTAESALSEIESILQRMRELSVQAANDTYDESDRATIQNEINQLNEEVDRIAKETEFNTMPLLDGTLSRRSYADVDGVETISLTSAVNEGIYTFTVTGDATQASADLAINVGAGAIGVDGSVSINGISIDISSTDTLADIQNKLVSSCDGVGITYDKAAGTITTKEYGISQELDIKVSDDLVGIIAATNVKAGTDVAVTLGAGFANTATSISDGKYLTVRDISGFEMVTEIDPGLVKNAGGNVVVNNEVTSMGTMTVQLGANEGQVIEIDIPKVDSHSLGLDNVYVGSHAVANDAISTIDAAIERVSSVRSSLGAYQNRLESAVSHLGSYTLDMTSALSSIEDTDMAEEMTEYTQQNVITQAATSMLAQANERPQSVLQLLQ